MEIGSFMGLTFTVSDTKILTPRSLSGSAGSDWASHERLGEKARSQWVSPKLKSYSVELLLRKQDGVDPRSTLETLQDLAESGKVDHFVVGSRPLAVNPFKLVSVSDEWGAVMRGGVLLECTVTLEIEEYV